MLTETCMLYKLTNHSSIVCSSYFFFSLMIISLSFNITSPRPTPCFELTKKQGSSVWLFSYSNISSALGSTSLLFATTMAGLVIKASLYYFISFCSIFRVSQGAFSSQISKNYMSTLVLSICRKKSSPNPLFLCASSIIPGISATEYSY